MHEIQLSAEGMSADELLENLLVYAQEGELTFDKSVTRGGTLLYDIIFAFTTNLGASYLYDALKNIVSKKPTTQIRILVNDDIVEVDVDSLPDHRELFIEKQKGITAIKIISHA
jgi:hypothetical protein